MSYEILLVKKYNGAVMISGNPIEVTAAVSPYFSSLAGNNLYVVANVKLQNTDGVEVYTLLKDQKIYPNSNGMVGVDIASIADAYLEYFVPPIGLDNTVRCTRQIRTFMVEFILFNGTENLSTVSDKIRILKAGSSYHNFNPNNELAVNNVDEQILMQPAAVEKCFASDVFFLYVTINAEGSNQPVITAGVNFLKADGTTGTYSFIAHAAIDSVSQQSVICFPAGYQQLGLHNHVPAGAVAMSYYILIVYFNGLPNPKDRQQITFNLEQRNFYNTKQLLYRNSLGSLLPIRIKGNIDSEASYDYQLTGSTPVSYLKDGNIVGTQQQQYAAEDWKEKGETGFITKFETERLRDFFLSPERYEVQDGRLLPIVVNNKNVKYYSNADNLFNLSIEWQHAFKNNFYTPFSGLMDACPAMLSFFVKQVTANTLKVFWSLPVGYDYFRVQLLFPDEDPIYVYIDGNSGVYDLSFIRPASATGTVTLAIKGQVVCNRYNKIPGFGPVMNAESITLQEATGPVAVTDLYNILTGFTTPQVFAISVLANDFDANGNALTATAVTNVATTQGGLISITAAGIVTYTPPSGSFLGDDTYTYTLNAGAATTTGLIVIRVSATAVTGSIFVITGWADYTTAGFETIANSIYMRFLNSPLSITPYPVTNLTVNYRKTVKTYSSADGFTTPVSTVDTDYTAIFNGGQTTVYAGPIPAYTLNSFGFPANKIETSIQVLPGAGYTVV